MKVWIKFSRANDYNQPEKAFESIHWEKPIDHEVDKVWYIGDCEFWYECFENKE